jgi:hypothetical protein
MKVWLVVAKVSEIRARSVEKVFDSEEKANKYVREQEKGEMPTNLSGFARINIIVLNNLSKIL